MPVFLKDFWPVYNEALDKEPGAPAVHAVNITFAGLLEVYLTKTRCPLPLEVVRGYLAQNRALLLLDGLDEVPETLRDDLVE